MAVKKPATRKRSTTKTTRSSRTARATKRSAKSTNPENAAAAEATATTEVAEQTATSMAATIRTPAQTPRGGDQPSRYTDDHYLHATAPQAESLAGRRQGKWLIFVSRSRVDALWDTVRRAVEKGRLGHAAKVTTALPEPNARDPKKHTIAVYTADESDAADVRRVRDVLRGLGVTWRIPYKSDAAAMAGKNDEMAGGPATRYYE